MNTIPAPTPLDIARKELHAAEEAWRKAPPGLKPAACRKRAELSSRLIAARVDYSAAFCVEFGEAFRVEQESEE